MLPMVKIAILAVTASLLTGGALVVLTNGSGGSDRGLDTDGDGLYDWLVVDMPLKAEAAGYYTVYAVLGTHTPYGGSCMGLGAPGPMPLGPTPPIVVQGPTVGSPEPSPDFVYPISWAVVRAFYEAGDHTVSLAFRGTDIGYAGVDGPYIVQAGVFSDGGDPRMGGPGILPGPTFFVWTYTTQPYRASAFEVPRFAIRFAGTYADRGVDANGNGLYDGLVVEAPADVNLAGTYSFSAALTAPLDGNRTGDLQPYPGFWIASAYGTVDFAEGRQTLAVTFNGGDIWASEYSGAMDVSLYVYYGGSNGYGGDGKNGTVPPPLPPDTAAPGGFDVYGDALCGVTSEYRHEQWDELVEPATFTGVFADRGEDHDGDGLYNVLAVDVGVNVTAPSRFEFSAQLMSGDGATYVASDWQDLYLQPGVQTLTLRFPGPAIAASGVDGPYRAEITLVARRDPQTTYTTGPYAHTDFNADGNNSRGMIWIANLSADASELRTTVQRGPDLLAVVMDGTVRVRAWASDGTLAFEGNATVRLPSGGGSEAVAFAWTPVPDTYIVEATLTSSWGTDAVKIVVTV